eukprot:scaffold1841_cov61-Phaeocystis_antarctica.AAC.5
MAELTGQRFKAFTRNECTCAASAVGTRIENAPQSRTPQSMPLVSTSLSIACIGIISKMRIVNGSESSPCVRSTSPPVNVGPIAIMSATQNSNTAKWSW